MTARRSGARPDQPIPPTAEVRPSRRRVMQLLAAAVAAAVAGPELARQTAPRRSTWTGQTRWIGHC